MAELAKYGDKRMTVREVAEALGVTDRTIRRHAYEMGLTENGKPTLLNEGQATEIKSRIEKSGRSDLDNVVQLEKIKSDHEMMQRGAEFIAWQTAKMAAMKSEMAALEYKAESFDALQRSERTMSITDASKHFGIHPKTHTFPWLRARGYLTQFDLPAQDAIDEQILALRENVGPDGKSHPQAVVLACQLEKWRVSVVPRIKAWIGA